MPQIHIFLLWHKNHLIILFAYMRLTQMFLQSFIQGLAKKSILKMAQALYQVREPIGDGIIQKGFWKWGGNTALQNHDTLSSRDHFMLLWLGHSLMEKVQRRKIFFNYLIGILFNKRLVSKFKGWEKISWNLWNQDKYGQGEQWLNCHILGSS